MENFVMIQNNQHLTISSMEIAEMVEKRHSDLLRDIEIYSQYLENAELRSQDFFSESCYKASGNNKNYKCYEITRKGCEFVANKLTGQKGTLFTATYINRFHDMENSLRGQATIPTIDSKFMFQIAQQLEEKEKQIQQMKPKVLFAEAVENSSDVILVKEMALLITQSGFKIGQNQLYQFLRDYGFLCKKLGDMYHLPTKKHEQYFKVTKRTFQDSKGIRVTNTPKINGKGQMYFIKKFEEYKNEGSTIKDLLAKESA